MCYRGKPVLVLTCSKPEYRKGQLPDAFLYFTERGIPEGTTLFGEDPASVAFFAARSGTLCVLLNPRPGLV